MGKSKRLPNDIVLTALQLVRGQARRKVEYKRQVDDIIMRSGTNFVDTKTLSGTPVRVYLPHAGGNTSDTTADKAAAIQQLEQQQDVKIMRAIDAAADEIGADIQSATVRAALQKAIALNCNDCRIWTFERLNLPGISRREFYRRRRKYLENVAQRVGLG